MSHVRSFISNGVLVFGMHRSGTSAVAAGLERLGVVMGETLAAPDEWNARGYFEERRIVAFNDHLLGLQGLRWDSPLPAGPNRQQCWSDEIEPARTLLQELFADKPCWGFKDPRMCLLNPFWQPVFSSLRIKPSGLLVLRHPAEVADSLARRDGLSVRRAGWLWFTHLVGALRYLQHTPDRRLIDFADLLRAPARCLQALGEWLGLPTPQATLESFAGDFISPSLARSAEVRTAEIHPLVLRAYEYWQGVAAHGQLTVQSLEAPEWLAIREAFDHEIRPELETVQRFFEGDRQAWMTEARLAALAQGLANSEQLALARLEQIASLDAQLKRTDQALAFAEALAFQRLTQVQDLDRALQTRDQRWRQVEQAMSRREDSWIRHRADLERLAESRLQQIHALDRQLRQTSEALAHAEQLALTRLAELQEQRESK